MANFVYELYIDSANEWRYRILAKNGNNIGSSGEGYKNFGDLFEIVKKIKAPDSEIKIVNESTDTKQFLME